jgi:predicted O-linked N-acetylglucosamine transferase (SPINDLY family)
MELSELIEQAGLIQAQQGPAASIDVYQSWLAQHSEHPTAHVARFNLAVLLSDAGRPAEAEAHLRAAIERFPSFLQAYFNLGLAVERQGRKDEALTHWLKLAGMADLSQEDQKELAISALNQIGRLQEVLKNYPQAEAALKQSLLLNPKQPDALQHWIHLRQKQCKWPVYEEFGEVREYDMLMATSPLAMLALTDDPVKQLLAATNFVNRKFNYPEAKRPPPWQGHEKIRLGYVSGDLCTHAVGLLLPDFLEAHDKSKFELYAYDFSPEDGSETRARLKAVFDHFVDIKTMSDEEVAAKVRSHEIDVLIDMHGLSSGARPKIFALRPAHLQLTWLGYIGTTAFPWIDYVVADETLITKTGVDTLSERILSIGDSLLPHGDLAHYKKSGNIKSNFTSAPPSTIVLACFNNIYKVTEEIVTVWAKILMRSRRRAKLILLADNEEAKMALSQKLGYFPGVSEMVEFVPRVSYQEHKARLAETDLILDTFPYNGGSTARDVLSCGVPFVTLAGKTLVSNMGAGILKECGLNDLVADSYSQYERIALKFIENEEFRCKIVEKIIFNSHQVIACTRQKTTTLEGHVYKLMAKGVADAAST